MRRATGNAVAAVMAVVGTAALAAVLTGCRAQSVASQPAGATSGLQGTSAAAANGGGGGAPAANGAAGAGVDSDMNSVDGQLSGLDSALAQATQSPSDGG